MAAYNRRDSLFRPFTRETLFNIKQRIAEEKAQKKADKEIDSDDEGSACHTSETEPKPKANLVAGRKLPPSHEDFPMEIVGRPIEDLDDYYKNQITFNVIGRDKTIYRFNGTNSLYIFSPFNPFRRLALFISVHPIFNVFVILTILVNCVFMTLQNKALSDRSEWVFTGIYTIEMCIKITARGFILTTFSYLRDPWNWLDSTVIAMAYMTELIQSFGKLSVLRTFRVFRALKTVAVIPGLKTIVGALLEAVRRLRDVMILTCFLLSIFALVGLQLYRGVLRHKCIRDLPPDIGNITDEEWWMYIHNKENWLARNGEFIVCGNASSAGKCPSNHSCIYMIGDNPNKGYTSFDNFGWAILCAFRLMTQDYWESLYQLVLRSMGLWHVFFFLFVILLCSFYLVNLILAIVTMSYDEQQKQDRAEAEKLNLERQDEQRCKEQEMADRIEQEVSDILSRQNGGVVKSPSDQSCRSIELYINVDKPPPDDRASVHSETSSDQHRRVSISVTGAGKNKRASISLPGSPFSRNKATQFSWKRHGKSTTERRPIMYSYLHNASLPYADDSNAATPTSEDLCKLPRMNKTDILEGRRASFLSHRSHIAANKSPTHLQSPRAPHHDHSTSRRSSFNSQTSRHSRSSKHSFYSTGGDQHKNKCSKTENLVLKSKGAHLLPEVIVDKTKLDDNWSSSSDQDVEAGKVKYHLKDHVNNYQYLCRTPSTVNLDPKDVVLLKELVEHVSGPRGSFMSATSDRPITIRERLYMIFCDWTCCPCFIKFQKIVELFVLDAFMDLFITLCIGINTLFMAMDQYPMDKDLAEALEFGNLVFTGIFTVEAVLKIIALSPMTYLHDGWNVFDSFIVLLSVLELFSNDIQGLSVLRTFRLLRVFKLAKSWPTLNMLISIVGRTLSAMANLSLVLLIVIFIFAVMGQQLFGKYYTADKYPDGEIPRWSFIDFFHSFMIVFRVLCGEWIESMWSCMEVAKWPCVPFFLLTMIIGNLVVLNLFLALLLSAFGSDSFQKSDDVEEQNKLSEALDRFQRFFTWVKVKIIVFVKLKKKRFKKPVTANTGYVRATTRVDINGKEVVVDGGLTLSNGNVIANTDQITTPNDNRSIVDGTKYSKPEPIVCNASPASLLKKMQDDSRASITSSNSSISSPTTSQQNVKVDAEGEPEITEVDVVYARKPDNCFCNICHRMCVCCVRCSNTRIYKRWYDIRCKLFFLVEHKYFETFVITMILASSISLAVEDVHIDEKPQLKLILYYLDKLFTVIFICEMVLKWAAFGFKKYFTNAWCWLDVIIVFISVVMLIGEAIGLASMSAFRGMRTLRALRPLRAVSRWEGMKVVVNALIKAIPAIFNVFIVCIVFWLIFGIMGVQLFGGKFWKCVDGNGTKLPVNIVNHRNDCRDLNYTWVNSKVNFDNVGSAYLALFQVATFKGWVQIMSDATDIRDADMQPSREYSVYYYLYFILFIILGSFFTLNLFVGVIIENFNNQKKKAGGSLEMFMTEDQKKYYKAMKQLSTKKPQKSIPRPRFILARWCFDITTNQKFDIGIMVFIMINMGTMALEHHDQDPYLTYILKYVNKVFIGIFTFECVLKLIALRHWYFKFPWNVFDFSVVVVSILALALQDFIRNYMVLSPTLLRVIRVFRVGRVLRLVKSAKGIRTLLFSLAVSIPALFNIALLLFLVMFIYATFGMAFFMHVKHTGGIDDAFNFETFISSIIVLFQMSTSAGWDGILDGLTNTEDCGEFDGQPDNCGKPLLAKVYLATYIIFSFLVVINMYIAVILENFSQATEDVQQGLTPDDFDMYYEKWEKYDPKATQYIPLQHLSDFVDFLEEPLRLPKPNHFILVKMDIPICENDICHCVDILDALTKNYLGTTDTGVAEPTEKNKDDKYIVITSTLRRQKEHYAARILQRAVRAHFDKVAQKTAQAKSDGTRSSVSSPDTMSPESRTVVLHANSDAVV